MQKMLRILLLFLLLVLSPSNLLLAQEQNEPLQSIHYSPGIITNSGVVTPGDVLFLAVHGYNSGPTQYFHLYNLGFVPTNGTKPFMTFKIQSASNFHFDLVGRSIRFDRGISWSNSSVLDSKVIGLEDIWVVSIEYR